MATRSRTYRSRKTAVAQAARRAAAGAEARYDAAGAGRRIAGWNPPTTGPNRAITGLQKIRDRARDSTRNDWAAESAIGKWTTNLVGWGIIPHWASEKVETLWADHFVRQCDADGVLDFYGLETLGVRTWLDAGEAFLRRRPRAINDTSPLKVPLQIQLLEGEMCPLLDTDTWPGLPAGNTIRQGIERDKYGQRRAYWFWKEHPGDGELQRTPRSNELVRVPARDVIHLYRPIRPGQLRGVSLLAPVLVKLRNAGDLEDAVLDRQKLANLFAMFIERTLPPEWDDVEFDELTGLPKFYLDGQPIAGLEPGIAQELRPGEKVTFANPPEAGTTYSEYMSTTHQGTASGAHLPYELMAGNIANVSDRTLRIVINEFRRLAQQWQWQIIIPMMCQRVAEWFAEAAVLAGELPLSELEAAKKPTWVPHGWEYIHPVQDVQGKIMARDANLTSTSAIIRERGEDPRKVHQEIKDDEKSGLTPKPEPMLPGPGGAPAGKGGPPPGKTPSPTASDELLREIVALAARPQPQPQQVDVQALVAGVAQAFVAALAPTLQAIVAQAQQKMPDIHNHLPAPAAPVIENHVAVPAPVIENTVNVPAPEVHNHLPAPQVVVENNVNVQPAEVKVDLPPRQTVSEIERDATGDIKKVTQTERTLQ